MREAGRKLSRRPARGDVSGHGCGRKWGGGCPHVGAGTDRTDLIDGFLIQVLVQRYKMKF